MVKWLHVGVRCANVEPGLTFVMANRNESLRLQPPLPDGSERTVGKGKGPKVLGSL
jgi:hypothetical protein